MKRFTNLMISNAHMKRTLFFIATLTCLHAIGQVPTNLNKVEFFGNKVQVMRVAEEQVSEVVGKLSTGETVKAGCYDYECYFRIEYKGRILGIPIDPSSLFEVYEYDFGGDDDKELLLIEYDEAEPNIKILSYSKGNASLMLQETISPSKTIIRQNYIECLDPTGLPTGQVWHYYKGAFWEMSPVSND